jgi:hypothetical protein
VRKRIKVLPTCYISGKITGLPFTSARLSFERAEQQVVNLRMVPVNPMKLVPYKPELSWEDYMKEDIAALLKCDSIFMLTNWGQSKGARVEHAIAKELGLKVIYQE